MRPALLIISLSAAFALKHRVPVLDLGGNDKFRGSAKENERDIRLSPEIRLKDDSGPICQYTVSGDHDISGDIPFVVEVRDQATGAGQLKVKEKAKLDCKQSPYRFRIAGKRCDEDSYSEMADVEVTIQSSNEHTPEFDQPWYSKTVEEGRLYGEILRLRAKDEDCGTYGEICRYEITNNAVPFVINDQGVLKNTQPLNYSQSHSHILSVVAHDCGMKHSKPVLVTIKVTESCILGLQGVKEQTDYYPGTGAKLIADEATVSTCGLECDVERVEGKVTLKTEHIGRGCDRESFASPELRKSCNVDPGTVYLLPKPANPIVKKEEKEKENEVTGDLTEDEDGSDEIYLFDGKNNAVVISPETTKPDVPNVFTLSFWMKHDRASKEEEHSKENILCSSDDHKMNRHHFALYVRNCKLEMLVRREKGEGEEETKFRPAEWRWSLPQVCDNQWHHYTVGFNFPQADLYVDGRALPTSADNPEILDDYPMHSAQLKTKMVVGACWHGRTSTLTQFFKGYLSSMLYLPEKTEHPGVLQCLHQCKEQLQFNGLSNLRPREEVVFNNEMSEMTLRADSLTEFEQLMKSVAYVNLRHDPTPGHRGFSVNTALKCKDKSDAVDLPEVKGYLFVKKAPEPSLKLTASGATTTRTRSQAHEGTNMLPDLKIVVTQIDGDGETAETTEKHKLDWCHIRVNPALNKDQEYFSSPAALISTYGLDFEHDKDGLLLKGIQSVKGYEEVLRQIHYFNLHPDEFPKRIFVVQCSMLNGRVLSNEFSLTMNIEADPTRPPTTMKSAAEEMKEAKKVDDLVLHHDVPEKAPEHRLKADLKADAPPPNVIGSLPIHDPGYEGTSSDSGVMAGGAVAIVVVVCIGFLLVIIVIGILRMRGVSRRKKSRRLESEGDLAWDDSGMKIIVNPIGEEADAEAGPMNEEEEYSDEDSSDDGDSYRDDEDEMSEEDDEEEEEEEVLPHVAGNRQGSTGLEWDDSTLHPAMHSPRARTYRV